MVLLDFSVNDIFTEKLNVPEGLQVTDPSVRGWFISPFGMPNGDKLQVWAMFAAILPAILLYLLLFMETHICELIMMEKTNAKGGGLHLDIVLLSLINCVGGFLGGPWICAATVRAVSHVSALTVMSTTHAPGEAPKIVEVKDQRVSGFMVSVILGLSVLLSPLLQHVPYAVLFGVFLYMGVSSMNGVQLFDRIHLFLMPVKHHPQVSYVKRVSAGNLRFIPSRTDLPIRIRTLGEDLQDAFVHHHPNLRPGRPMGGQVDAGGARIPILRRRHDPAQDAAQLCIHQERAQRGKQRIFYKILLIMVDSRI